MEGDIAASESNMEGLSHGRTNSTSANTPEVYDLLIIVDATSSMSIYLDALQSCLPSIISISALTGCFGHIGLLGYRDYCDNTLLDWSGWLDPAAVQDPSQPNLQRKARNMEPEGGGDWPEALKTALARAYELARPEAKTLTFLYTDAPPHLDSNRARSNNYSNWLPERTALMKPSAYGGFGKEFIDWVGACRKLRRGEKLFEVFSFLPNKREMDDNITGLFSYLAKMTRGSTIQFEQLRPEIISKVTIEVLLAWTGVEKAGEDEATRDKLLRASLVRYVDITGINDIKTETDTAAGKFFVTKHERPVSETGQNLARVEISQNVLAKHLPKKKTPVTNFSEAWKTNSSYRTTATFYLQQIIEQDVQAMTTNPVFGSLWRTVCSDRLYEQREILVQEFSKQVGQIEDPAERLRMNNWLEESYDYAAEISEIIEAVPEAERFPCVCLDPTLRFVREDASDDPNQPASSFTRAELLEIGRSCDSRILARLSKVLTRLTYVQSAADMPEHIAMSSPEKVPRIPMALASYKYENKFWRILMHCIVPGTLLSSRPAALVAALALSLGIEPLMEPAANEMLIQRGNWNSIKVPENWNVSCLSLLLQADQANTARGESAAQSLLKKEDRALFEQLIAFHILEANLKSPLEAQVAWTPNKSLSTIGPLIRCHDCQFPRSVTIMQNNGTCGICASKEYANKEKKQKAVLAGVSADSTEESSATWVECFVPTCRAQYVVYNVADLNVRAKCHFCRTTEGAGGHKGGKAPCVECSKCRSRMIYPAIFRPKTFAASEWVCPACTAGKATVVGVETSLSELQKWSDMAWLVKDKDDPKAFPLKSQMQSLFKELVSLGGPDEFARRITTFSTPAAKVKLSLSGKSIHDPPAIRATLEGFVAQRSIGRDVCSLCFNEFRMQTGELSAACGRRSCKQKLCKDCLAGWYGLNGPGKIINTAALSCPFCRQRPAASKLRRFAVHAVADLQQAIDRSGRWIYAWCSECGHAREYLERQCARGAPDELDGWVCNPCTERQDAARREMEAIRLQVRAEESDERERRELLRKIEQLQMANVKPCPKCGVMTAKTGGCDHIECSACRCHWCFFCGEQSSHSEIYRHMSTKHGGYGIGQYDDDYDTDEDEW